MALDLRIFEQERIAYYHEEIDRQLQGLIQELLPVGGTFVDCGANTGFFGLLAIYWRQAFSVFIEPHPTYARQIETHLSLNEYRGQARIFETAISDYEGRSRLTLQDASGVTHHLIDSPSEESHAVSVRKLRFLFDEQIIPRIDFLRLDIEGHEYRGLLGLEEYLAPEHVKAISYETSSACREIFDLLSQKGYAGFGTYDWPYYRVKRFEKRHGVFPGLFLTQQGEKNMIWVQIDSPEERRLQRWSEIHRQIRNR